MSHRYYYKQGAVSKEDCENFLAVHKNKNWSSGELDPDQSEFTVNDRYRKSSVQWIPNNNVIARVVWSYMLEMNGEMNLNLTGYQDPQLTKYTIDDHYDWHKDSNHNDNSPIQRKLSAVLQLSNANDYKGCELKLFNGALELEELPIKEQGDLIVFRSEEWHKITPLIEGERYSLVMWAMGNKLV
tara:strand:- start:3041 stop:3595 length:555 start_codon:yes stop_codon:yes gene_type:complete